MRFAWQVADGIALFVFKEGLTATLFVDLIVHPTSCLTPYIPNKPVEFPLLNGMAMFVVVFLFLSGQF